MQMIRVLGKFEDGRGRQRERTKHTSVKGRVRRTTGDVIHDEKKGPTKLTGGANSIGGDYNLGVSSSQS